MSMQMGSRLLMLITMIYLQIIIFVSAATNTDPNDFAALSGVMGKWQNLPPSWSGNDPCGTAWQGIQCSATSRITSIVLSGVQLKGTLSPEIANLPMLQYLDLSQNKGLTGTLPSEIGNLKNLLYLSLVGCSFYGPIPSNIGSLAQLTSLSLTSNNFSGEIPPSIGNLWNLSWLDITDNKLTGSIPVSNSTSPGLDLLVNTQHFHFGQNQLTGSIPSKLFSSNMSLVHVLFDNNQLSGSIPSSIEKIQSLEALRLDRNNLSGPVLVNFTSLINLSQLYLSNNNLNGSIPDLSGMNNLTYVDMSNNSFNASVIPPWFSSLQSLTSLLMEGSQLYGSIPSGLFSVAEIQSIVLSNNNLNGTLDLGTNYDAKLTFIDMQNNNLSEFAHGSGYSQALRLQGNPYCKKTGSSETYCSTGIQTPNCTYSTPPNNCVQIDCKPNQICSPNCTCSYPIKGSLQFLSCSLLCSGTANPYIDLQAKMMDAFLSNRIPVDSIALSDPTKDIHDNLFIDLEVFPSSSSSRFDLRAFSNILSQLNNGSFFDAPKYFGAYHFIPAGNMSDYFPTESSSSSSNTAIIIGATVGGSVLMLLLLAAVFYAFHQRKKADTATHLRDPFASWEQNESGGSRPQVVGVKCFSFEELRKCTNNFSDANVIGIGGYGTVYRGNFASGTLVAIKRAKQGSLQGSAEFKTEIELLSRIHHKNLVSLMGFCYEQGEQMLVYEYVPNGTLKDSITGKSGIQLNWARRLRIALDSSRGLAYLHEHANPPIVHRDVKSTNILLDDQLIAKVADFGLSKLLEHSVVDPTSQVRGTKGYMDPEFFVTHQFTDKSDVYSFGVTMLELVTGRNPIQHGRYIVEVVKIVMDKTKTLYNLQEVLDPAMGLGDNVKGLEKFVDLAIKCVEDWGVDRPTMGEVVKEIERIIDIAGADFNDELFSTLANYDESTTRFYIETKSFFEYSGNFPHSGVEQLQ